MQNSVYACVDVYFYFVPNYVSIDILCYPGNIDDNTDLMEPRRLIVSVNQYVKPLKRRRSKLLFYLQNLILYLFNEDYRQTMATGGFPQ